MWHGKWAVWKSFYSLGIHLFSAICFRIIMDDGWVKHHFMIQEKTAQCLLNSYLEWDCVELFCFFSIVMNNLWARGLFLWQCKGWSRSKLGHQTLLHCGNVRIIGWWEVAGKLRIVHAKWVSLVIQEFMKGSVIYSKMNWRHVKIWGDICRWYMWGRGA